MRKLVSIFLFIILIVDLILTFGLLIGQSRPAKESVSLQTELSEINHLIIENQKRIDRIERQLTRWAKLYEVAECESNLNHQSQGDNGKANGILQYHKTTFDWLSLKANFKGDYLSQRDQIALGLWAFDNDYGYLWTCYRKEVSNDNDGE